MFFRIVSWIGRPFTLCTLHTPDSAFRHLSGERVFYTWLYVAVSFAENAWICLLCSLFSIQHWRSCCFSHSSLHFSLRSQRSSIWRSAFYATHIFTFNQMHSSTSLGPELLSIGWYFQVFVPFSNQIYSTQWIPNDEQINQLQWYRKYELEARERASELANVYFENSVCCKSHLALVMIIFQMLCQSNRFHGISFHGPNYFNEFNDF